MKRKKQGVAKKWACRLLVTAVALQEFGTGWSPVIGNVHAAEGDIPYECLTIRKTDLNKNVIWGQTEDYSNDIGLDTIGMLYDEVRAQEISETYPVGGGLAKDGTLTMGSGIPYRFNWNGNGVYDGEDSVCVDEKNQKIEFQLETTGSYSKLHFLAAAGNAAPKYSANFEFTIHYTDGTQAVKTCSIFDWFNNKEENGNELYKNIVRIVKTGEKPSFQGELDDVPYLQSFTIEAEPDKLIQSIEFKYVQVNDDEENTEAEEDQTFTSGIFAVTGEKAEKVIEELAIPVANPAKDVQSTSFVANWKPVENAIGYVLDVSTDDKFTAMVDGYNNQSVTETSIDVTDLEEGTTYYYRVRAVNEDGQTASSNIIEVVPGKVIGADVTVSEPTDGNAFPSDFAVNDEHITVVSGVWTDAADGSVGGTPFASEDQYKKGSTVTAEITLSPAEGYQFAELDEIEKYTINGAAPVTSSANEDGTITLTYQYTELCNMTYLGYDDATVKEDETREFKEKVSGTDVYRLPELEKEGYEFAGWKPANNATDYDETSYEVSNASGDEVFAAVWKVAPPVVTDETENAITIDSYPEMEYIIVPKEDYDKADDAEKEALLDKAWENPERNENGDSITFTELSDGTPIAEDTEYIILARVKAPDDETPASEPSAATDAKTLAPSAAELKVENGTAQQGENGDAKPEIKVEANGGDIDQSRRSGRRKEI